MSSTDTPTIEASVCTEKLIWMRKLSFQQTFQYDLDFSENFISPKHWFGILEIIGRTPFTTLERLDQMPLAKALRERIYNFQGLRGFSSRWVR